MTTERHPLCDHHVAYIDTDQDGTRWRVIDTRDGSAETGTASDAATALRVLSETHRHP